MLLIILFYVLSTLESDKNNSIIQRYSKEIVVNQKSVCDLRNLNSQKNSTEKLLTFEQKKKKMFCEALLEVDKMYKKSNREIEREE